MEIMKSKTIELKKKKNELNKINKNEFIIFKNLNKIKKKFMFFRQKKKKKPLKQF